MSKKIGILFSSGLDSTYLMWKALKDGHDVYPIYIRIENNGNKVLIEKQQCELIIKKLNKEFDKKITLNHSISIDVHNSKNLWFAQPFLWSSLLNIGLDTEVDEIQIGYVYGDSVIAYISDIKKVHNASKPFMHNHSKLTFPITKIMKEEIARELPEQYLKLVVSCENPQLKPYGIKIKTNGEIVDDFKYRFFEPCGDCHVCNKIISNDYYGCDVTRKNYIEGEKMYNRIKLAEFTRKNATNSDKMPAKEESFYDPDLEGKKVST